MRWKGEKSWGMAMDESVRGDYGCEKPGDGDWDEVGGEGVENLGNSTDGIKSPFSDRHNVRLGTVCKQRLARNNFRANPRLPT